MAKKRSVPPDFEQSLQELEALVEALEGDTLSLEEALQQFEQGIALARHCNTALNEAEQRVEQLLADSEGHPQVVALADERS